MMQLDADDRQAVTTGLLILGGLFLGVPTAAALIGVSFRLFRAVAGI